MGYFSCGCEGMNYEAEWCDNCVHQHPKFGCPIWDVHLLYNYEECNKPDSILHKLIPRTKNGLWNDKCVFFEGNPIA